MAIKEVTREIKRQRLLLTKYLRKKGFRVVVLNDAKELYGRRGYEKLKEMKSQGDKMLINKKILNNQFDTEDGWNII